MHTRIYRLWPPEIASHFQFRRDDEDDFESADFSDVFFRSSENEGDFKSMQISWMGERARLVFDIPAFPDLPVVENQFETPMPLVYFSEPKDLIAEIGQATELRIRLNEDYPAPTDEFPMIVRDTTPVELIKLYERVSGAPLYYDRGKGEITDLRPEGVIDKVIDWVKEKTAKLAP
ncbi:hypothetical protein N9B21_01225 [Verrucomicrobiales bacterium]|nr:hypothetical protein [Verrucomicrobiales bacterium]